MNKFSKNEICELTGLDETLVNIMIEREWVVPADSSQFDEEDLARLHFIVELEQDLGANEAAIPIILHLVDQLHSFRHRLTNPDRFR